MTQHQPDDFAWQYPIYVIAHGFGYASLVDSNDATRPVHLLVVLTERHAAEEFVERCEIVGEPRELKNDREFGWLLQSLQAPVSEVAFDPQPTDDAVNPRWRVSLAELLESHLAADNSPWNYPVYAIAQRSGFVCIDGQAGDGRSIAAVGIFTSEAKAENYLQDAGETGSLCALNDMNEARSFFESLGDNVVAVALDPKVADDRRTAKHCFAVSTLLKKYLVPSTSR